MELTPLQTAAAACEFAIVIAGAVILARALSRPALRRRWFGTNRLPRWEISGPEVLLLVIFIFLSGLFVQSTAQYWLAARIAGHPDRAGIEVFAYGAAFHGGALLAWLVFPVVRRRLQGEYGIPPPPDIASRPLRSPKIVVAALTAVAAVLPVLSLVNLAWGWALNRLGLPSEAQPLVGIFSETGSPLVFAGMFAVACILAPINEELLFRRVIYRWLRQRFGRASALTASALLFAALHFTWAGFLPLALLGATLALAYEATGDIRVSMVAHGLFNLNSVLIVLSGLSQ